MFIDEHGGPDDQDDPHHQRRIAVARGTHRQLAHAGPGEDLLGDDRAGDELREQEPDDRDDRDEGVPERVADDDGRAA